MAQRSTIEWTDATWNPVRGCTKISPGCAHCYAETFAERWRGIRGHPYELGFELRVVEEKLAEPLLWTRSHKIFVNSMSDLFHDRVPDSYITRVFGVMELADWHVYQVLTKRADRMRELVNSRLRRVASQDHIWLGVSVENRKHGVPRIDQLRKTRTALRFLSIEPLIEDIGTIDLDGIDWVIVGGESGPGARPMHVEWVLSIRDQCHDAGVPFFFKQWGGVQKSKNGRELDGRTFDDMPRLCELVVPSPAERRRRLGRLATC
jgi:protein gp37